jgi:hypothetical protein
MKSTLYSYVFMAVVSQFACQSAAGQIRPAVKLITLDPGHFHAALVQKSMYEGVDSNVYVYAQVGYDVHEHLNRIKAYNENAIKPTHWNEKVYLGEIFWTRCSPRKKEMLL